MKNSTIIILAFVFITTGCSSIKVKKNTYKPNSVEVKVYTPSLKKARKIKSTIIVTPPTGGSTPLEHSYSMRLSKLGFKVVRILKWQGQNETNINLNIHKKLFKKAQNAIRTVIRENPSKKFGILGTSVGGLHAAVALGEIPEITLGVIITAGSPLSKVIAYSDQSALKEYRKQRKKKFSFSTTAEYAEALEETGLPDFKSYREAYSKKKILTVLASEDSTVPTEQQKELISIMSPDKEIEFESGHIWTILKNWLFKRDDITDFIDENL